MSTQLHLADTEPRLFALGAPTPKPTAKAKPTTPSAATSSTRRKAQTAPSAPRTALQDRNLAAVREAKAAKAAAATSRRNRTAASWQLDETTRQTGRAGLAAAREALLAARKAQFEVLDSAA